MSASPPAAAIAIGTRGSPLALAQARLVAALLEQSWPEVAVSMRIVETRGDRTQATGEPLPEIGGKGLFTAELEAALAAHEIDVAVHSLKDLPTADSPGLVVGAVCARDDVRDCLVSRDGAVLAELASGATIGTSSLRRAAQLRALRPDLVVEPVRGNVGTRVRKVRDRVVDAVVVAAAGVRRLGFEGEVSEWLGLDVMLPAPGQGALAVQCRAEDDAVLAALAPLDDAATRAATSAERTFLAALAAGCSAPVAAWARQDRARELVLTGLVASPDGQRVVRVEGRGADPEELGARLAGEALVAGAAEILGATGG
ncbi:MAG: porphobilinogen deaminase [Gaiellaceae bacterium]|nr:MAG: porphobilinogen deaminase [Gaiellaceae bacterium]